ncbi:ABC transporter substrate-binding protein [Pseudorhodoplanes sp.]|uniref:ABC transporter substrate-binding protein n=1 Tax=Pseudorhodoplanes sp. TaxID=1934341 RepID=UPI002B978E6C|nr:ABC transporter substrate-binding protein [Pseudorhodoplanes sp.]HWV43169.1 ABC transporter substrate-binding protein [Pseudorhodoplanes sp.]
MRALAALLCALICVAPCAAQAQGKDESSRRERQNTVADIAIGVGHGIGFLPLYVAQDQGLFDKHARAAGLRGKVVLRRFSNAAPMRQALARGEIAAAAYGLTPFLLARDANRRTPKELVAVAGLTTLPLVLLTARPNVKALSDLGPADKIAVPMLTAPQVTYLRMRTNPSFGGRERLRGQLVVLPHQDALEKLVTGSGIAAYFSSPPFTQIALQDPKVHAVDSSDAIMGGKTSFLVLASPASVVAAHPRLPAVLAKAIDEASGLIRKDPRRAATIWLKREPSDTLDARMVEGVLRDLKDDFGSGVFGIEATAGHLSRDNRLKEGVTSWKDVVAPAIAAGQGS